MIHFQPTAAQGDFICQSFSYSLVIFNKEKNIKSILKSPADKVSQVGRSDDTFFEAKCDFFKR